VPKFSKVLVVTDLSEASNRSVRFAYALVDEGGEVHLLHLLEQESDPSPLYAHYSPDSFNLPEERAKAQAAVETQLRKLVPPEAAARRITTQVAATVHPEIAPGIVSEAKARKVDVIVMSTHGRTGLKHLVLGSVCERVLPLSPVPVLVVPYPK
jgi:nucleotide-binding universal stress UspA family protein